MKKGRAQLLCFSLCSVYFLSLSLSFSFFLRDLVVPSQFRLEPTSGANPTGGGRGGSRHGGADLFCAATQQRPD